MVETLGDGNNTKLVGDIVNSSTQILSSVQEATDIDLTSLLAGYASGKLTKQAKNSDDKTIDSKWKFKSSLTRYTP